MQKINFLIILTTLLTLSSLQAQIKVSGTVMDGKTQKPVAYADVTLPNAGAFTTTNTDGSFYLESEENDSILAITADGFEFLEFELTSKVNYNLSIELKPDASLDENSTVELDAATITNKKKKFKNKKENPAYAIMQE